MRSSTILAAGLLAASVCVSSAFAQTPPAAPPIKVEKSGVGPKSKAEAEAVRALMQAQAPDEQIAAAEALLSKFADTDYKGFALELEAEDYQRKGDNAKAIFFAEQSLGADSKNYDADNLLASIYASMTKEKDLDSIKADNLGKVDKYAHDSLAALDGGRPAIYAKVSDDQWNKIKASATSQAWQALGMAAQLRNKNDEAAADFQKGIDALPDPLLEIRMGRLMASMKKYDEAIGWDQKVIDSPDAPAPYKKYAADDKQRFSMTKQSAK